MPKKDHVSETPATQWLKRHKIDYTEHPYEYLVPAVPCRCISSRAFWPFQKS